mmetsp:Transcript_130259/g.405172  ORF Transcript_130259/g.405172 Transcript_130259/m.405172 type:complete len:336 (-) Transcript_130259:229-1236(-)
MQMPSKKSLFVGHPSLGLGCVHSRWNSSWESSRELARVLMAAWSGNCSRASSVMSFKGKSSLLSSFTTPAPSRRSSSRFVLMMSTVYSTSSSSGPSRTSPSCVFGSAAWMAFWRALRSFTFLISGRCNAMAIMPSCMLPKPSTSSIDAFFPSVSYSWVFNAESLRRSQSGSTTSRWLSTRKARSLDLARRKLFSSSSWSRTSSAISRASVNSTAMDPALCVLLPARKSAWTSMSSGDWPVACKTSALNLSTNSFSLFPRTVAKERSMKRQCLGRGSQSGTRSQQPLPPPSTSSALMRTRSRGSPRVPASAPASFSAASGKARTFSSPETTSSGMA